MLRRGNSKAAGFSLVELIVVMTIFVILAAMAVAGFARLPIFSRNELNNTAQELHSLLVAANVYASAQHVNTAVVYEIDNFGAMTKPIVDSVTQQPLRVLQSAAMMYQLPSGPNKGAYASVPTDDGNFRKFPGGMVVFLWEMEPRRWDGTEPVNLLMPYYSDPDAGFDASATNCAPASEAERHVQMLGRLGMNIISVFDENRGAGVLMPAHVFTPSNRIDVAAVTACGAAGTDSMRERYRIYVGPSPDTAPDARLVNNETTEPLVRVK